MSRASNAAKQRRQQRQGRKARARQRSRMQAFRQAAACFGHWFWGFSAASRDDDVATELVAEHREEE